MARREAVFKKVQGKGFGSERIAYGVGATLGGNLGVRNPRSKFERSLVKPVVRTERVQLGSGPEGQPRVRFRLDGDARPRQQKMRVVGYCPADVFAIGALQGQIRIADRVDALIVPLGGGKLHWEAIAEGAAAENPRRFKNDVQHVARGERVSA